MATDLLPDERRTKLEIIAVGLGAAMFLVASARAQCPQTIDSTSNPASQIDDFTEHTYSVGAGPVGTFADCTITRTFANPIQSLTLTIVGGRADDIGFVGGLQVTNAPPACSDVSTVVAPVNVTGQVTVTGASASLVLRAQENCCCVTGWGSATQSDRANARLHWQVTLQSREVRLSKRGRTDIESGNQYSENTRLRATVVFPPGHPRAGQVDHNFTGMVTFTEEAGTTYYDGANGATLLPQTVQASSGLAEILVKSVSNSTNLTGPVDARIRADGPGLTLHAATNPLSVDQWVDENSNGFIDWLDQWTAAIDSCARGQSGEVRTVARHVSQIFQRNAAGACGDTPIVLANHGLIRISPVCGPGNRHRLNVGLELTDTVFHEARHTWQNSERNRAVGTNDDGNNATPRNDDDLDFWLQIVSLTSANSITETAGGTGDTTIDAGGLDARRIDAESFAAMFRNTCP